jgi:hypothetical protein
MRLNGKCRRVWASEFDINRFFSAPDLFTKAEPPLLLSK